MQRRLGPTKIGIFGLLQPSKAGGKTASLCDLKLDYMLKRTFTNCNCSISRKKNSQTITRLTYKLKYFNMMI